LRSGGALVSINEVNLRRARLALGMGDRIRVQFPVANIYLVCNQPLRSTLPGHPFECGRNEYQPKGSEPCGWGVNAGMVHMLVAGKIVWSPCYIPTIS